MAPCVCAEINKKIFVDCIIINVGTSKKPADWFPYTQVDTRKRPVWGELWRQRAAAADFFIAPGGHLHKQTDMDAVVLQAMRGLGIPEELYSESEAVAVRIRAIMSHIRNARVHNHVLPSRFQQLKGMVSLDKLQKVAKTPSPKTKKKEKNDSDLDNEDLFATASEEEDEENESDDEVDTGSDEEKGPRAPETAKNVAIINDADDSEVEVVSDSRIMTEKALEETLKSIFKPRARIFAKRQGSAFVSGDCKAYEPTFAVESDEERAECPTSSGYTKVFAKVKSDTKKT